MGRTLRPSAGAGLGALAALLVGLGCVALPFQGRVAYHYFAAPSPVDPWSPKISGWQAREQAQPDTEELRRAPASVSGSGEAATSVAPIPNLRDKYFLWRAEQKRSLARETAEWIQRQAKGHYVPDGPIDHWATLQETLDHDGDDCDGLELLVYHFLRDLGFGDDEVYRAIVYRPSDGQHHMVTFWFETPDDPWVIDPTGAMTRGMPRMSQVPEWIALKVFSEDEEFTVEARNLTRPPG